jgi:hypothetical protein
LRNQEKQLKDILEKKLMTIDRDYLKKSTHEEILE